METPVLSRATTFTLRVRRGQDHAEARTTVQARYRNAFRVLHDAPVAQTRHLASTLPDARAILMGGNTSEALNAPDTTLTQLFDPAGLMAVGDAAARGISFRTATPLTDGGALLTGGFGSPFSDSTERYDPAEAKWRAAGPMLDIRVGHTATLLRDGRVLIAGGIACCQDPSPPPPFYASSAEIYDPATDEFAETGSMSEGRGFHAAAVLPDGRVLISGGDGNDPDSPPLGTEIFDPPSGQFSPAGDLLEPRDMHTAVVLTDGRVLVVGGEVPPQLAGRGGIGIPATEIFDPATERWSAGPLINRGFYAATVTMLANGKVLVFGGEDLGGFPRANAALFE